jgi:hypothetical protein
MSQDRTEREYHLTPIGWMAGNFWVYGTLTEEKSAPSDRVETWIEEIDDPSGWASEIVTWKPVWVSPDVTNETRADLNQKFPQPRHTPRKAYPKKKKKKLADYY